MQKSKFEVVGMQDIQQESHLICVNSLQRPYMQHTSDHLVYLRFPPQKIAIGDRLTTSEESSQWVYETNYAGISPRILVR